MSKNVKINFFSFNFLLKLRQHCLRKNENCKTNPMFISSYPQFPSKEILLIHT